MGTSPTNDEPAIDMSALAPFQDDAEFLGLLVDEFFAEAPRRIVTLRTACVARDVAGLRSEGHALKGSARVFGAAPLAAMCQALESTQVIDTATGDCLDCLERELQRVRTALEAVRADAQGRRS